MKEVKDISLKEGLSIKELVSQMNDAGGFVAKKIGSGVEILKTMFSDKECTNFLSFPACIISTGTRGIIRDLVRDKKIQVIITTNGTLDHDLARLWQAYYHGTFDADDRELHKKGINRLGNVFIPNECYGVILEDKLQPILKELYEQKKEWSGHELIWAMGEAIEKENLDKKEESIVYWAWKNKIPVFIPGYFDGAVGSQIWQFWQEHKDFKINLLEDEQKLFEIVSEAKKTGALMLGGGISKHHTIWWNLFREGLNYAVYVTTAVEWDGSLSGARTREAISWGKVREDASFITIEGDATAILPILIGGI